MQISHAAHLFCREQLATISFETELYLLCLTLGINALFPKSHVVTIILYLLFIVLIEFGRICSAACAGQVGGVRRDFWSGYNVMLIVSNISAHSFVIYDCFG